MRHESIETTMGYYVDLDADELAEDLYRAHERGQDGQRGTVFGTVADSGEASETLENDATPYGTKGL
jgi:hypothetical protein